jgi:hypothetical protein
MVKPVQQTEVVVQQAPPAQETEIYVDVQEETPSVTIQEQYIAIDEQPLTVVLKDVPPASAKETCTAVSKMKRHGVKVSRELLEMAGFPEHQQIHNLMIK